MGIRYIAMRPGIGLCNRRSPRNGSRKYVARRITPSTASQTVVIAATIVTPTKVLVTADVATRVSAGSRGLPARGERLHAACWIRPRCTYRPRQRGETPTESLTFDEFCERYLERYAAIRTPVSVQTLAWRLARARREFGDMKLTEVRRGEVAAWESSLPPRFRHSVMRSFKQVLAAAIEWGYATQNAAQTGANPAPPVIERVVLEPAEVERLAAEMRPPYDVAVIVGAWCFLRPAELLGLERRDVGEGELRLRGRKTARSLRSTPLPLRARQARSTGYLRGSIPGCSSRRRQVARSTRGTFARVSSRGHGRRRVSTSR